MRKSQVIAYVAEAYWNALEVIEEAMVDETMSANERSQALSVAMKYQAAILEARSEAIRKLARELPDEEKRPFLAEPIPQDQIKLVIEEWEGRRKKK
jgi:hypothetical protein